MENCKTLLGQSNVNESLIGDALGKIFGGSKGSSPVEDIKKAFSFNFSFLNFLSGKKEEGKSGDKVRDAYLKCLEDKRDNAKKRKKELKEAKDNLKVTGIKLKHKLSEAGLENQHQEMMKMLKSQNQQLEDQLKDWDTIYNDISNGNTIPKDVLNREIARTERSIQNLMDGLPEDARTEEEQAMDVYMEMRYVQEKGEDGKELYDEDGNPVLKARTPEEMKEWLNDPKNKDKAEILNKVANSSEKSIADMSESEISDFAQKLDAADPIAIESKDYIDQSKAEQELADANETASMLAEETENTSGKNKLVSDYNTAKEELKSAEDKRKEIKDIEDGGQAQMYLFIQKNKDKKPWKQVIGEGENAKSIAEIAKDLGDCVSEDGTIDTSKLSEKLRGDGYSVDADIMDGVDTEWSENKPVAEKAAKANDAVKKAKEEATQKEADARQKMKDAKDTATEKGVEFDDDGNPKEVEQTISNELKAKLKEMGYEPKDGKYDLESVNAAVKANVKSKTEKVKTAAEQAKKMKDAQRDLGRRWRDAVDSNKKAAVNNDKDEQERQEKIKKELEKTKNVVNSDVETYDDDGSVVLSYKDENGKEQLLTRPDDMSDKEAMADYNTKRKLALVQKAADGGLTKPEYRVEKVTDGDGKVKYIRVPFDFSGKVEYENGEILLDGKKLEGDEKDKAELSSDDAMKIEIDCKRYERDNATVKSILQSGPDSKDVPEELRKGIQKLLDDGKGDDLFAEYELTDTNWDEDDEDDEDTTEKELKDAEAEAKKLKDDDGKALNLDDLDKIKEPTQKDGESDEDYEKRKKDFNDKIERLKKARAASDKAKDEYQASEEDDGGEDKDTKNSKGEPKPKPPKRKIKKVASKRKGFFKYVYKTQDGKKASASKADWQANVKAWNKYKKRLADWEKNKNESIVDVLRDKLVLERFYPQDIVQSKQFEGLDLSAFIKSRIEV
jgi:hypothetical protein